MYKFILLMINFLFLLACNSEDKNYYLFERELGVENVNLFFELEELYLSFLSSNYSKKDSCYQEVEFLRDVIRSSLNDYNIDTLKFQSVLEKVNKSTLFDQYERFAFLSVKELEPGSKIIEYTKQNGNKSYASYGEERIVYEERDGLTYAFYRDSFLMTTEELGLNEDSWIEPSSFTEFLKKEEKRNYWECVSKGEFIPALKAIQDIYPEFQEYSLDEYIYGFEAGGYNNTGGIALFLEDTYSSDCSHLSNYFLRRIILYSCFYEQMNFLMET